MGLTGSNRGSRFLYFDTTCPGSCLNICANTTALCHPQTKSTKSAQAGTHFGNTFLDGFGPEPFPKISLGVTVKTWGSCCCSDGGRQPDSGEP